MKHGAIALQESLVVNKKHVPQFGFSGTHEGFVYNLDFHLWLRQFPPGHKHEQRGQYREKCKKNHCGSSKTSCAQTASIKFSIRIFKIGAAQECQLRGMQLVHSAMDATALPFLPASHIDWMESPTSPAYDIQSFMPLATCRVDPENKRLQSLNTFDVNGRDVSFSLDGLRAIHRIFTPFSVRSRDTRTLGLLRKSISERV